MYAGRKFIAFCIMIGIATIVLVTRFIDGTVWRDVVIIAMGIFVGGNVASKYSTQNTTPKKEE